MASKRISSVKLSDIYKRCPQNQIKQFMAFQNQHAEYKKRADKYPEVLPKIDWEYYRKNVRSEYVKMVDDFEKKYAELNKIYDSRHELDTSQYYMELEKKREEVKTEVDKFKEESNKRIEIIKEEIERVNSLIPYDQMTIEEFCDSCPHHPPFYTCNGRPSFWPHTPEEQEPGPAGMPHGHIEVEGDVLTEEAMNEVVQERKRREEADRPMGAKEVEKLEAKKREEEANKDRDSEANQETKAVEDKEREKHTEAKKAKEPEVAKDPADDEKKKK